ncbi:LRR receptor serine/threonine-protein kinase FLS2 [Spatholobus suberectus]|nr:LRR receptor serine/threonine-protein kinase FLS2 [Spatholobus suberectus]
MENGNLDSIIHGKGVDQSVISRWTLSERVRVFISIASALDYLHSGYDSPIIHCDLKPSNILLDRDWEAHVSDFGTARILGLHLQDGGSTLSSSAALQGTVGYMAPEFAYMRKVTTKVDVFCFGIIVMEFLTKRRPTGLSEENGLPITLREVVAKALANGIEQLVNIVDPLLTWNVTEDCDEGLVELFTLSLCCTLPDPEHRPNMNEVLSTLVKLQTTLSC